MCKETFMKSGYENVYKHVFIMRAYTMNLTILINHRRNVQRNFMISGYENVYKHVFIMRTYTVILKFLINHFKNVQRNFH